MELFAERGFENTTVAEIAARAGLTERTFFRHFADKREVLFYGSAALQELLAKSAYEAPASLPPLEAIEAALIGATAFFGERREFACQRQAIIAANPELQEREQVKLAMLATALAEALRRRGVKEPAASLAAEAGVAVFKVAFQRWTAGAGDRTLAQLIRGSMDELKAVAGGGEERRSSTDDFGARAHGRRGDERRKVRAQDDYVT